MVEGILIFLEGYNLNSYMWRERLYSVLFHLLHSSIVLFSLTAWIFSPTRPYHIILGFSILFSWYVLGLFYYPGYCLFTDHHFRILRKMGVDPGCNSYIKYTLDHITPFRFEERRLNTVITRLFFCFLIVSILLYLRDHWPL
jgi:hypothetical protein